jgi:hypothetical protein
MSQQGQESTDGSPESHGVHGTQREDSKMQEEPSGTEGIDEVAWAEQTETGGDVT